MTLSVRVRASCMSHAVIPPMVPGQTAGVVPSDYLGVIRGHSEFRHLTIWPKQSITSLTGS